MSLPVRQIAADYYVAPQLGPEHMALAAQMGFKTVVNNRPDHEHGPGQPTNAEVQAAALAAGLRYHFVPTDGSASNPADIAALAALLPTLQGPVLAFCRSGNRSAGLYLRALQPG
jgi:sulfide:quinone oxidoreductase